MNDRTLDPSAIAGLAEEFLDRRQRGERPTVAEYAEKHPNLADQIHAFFPALLLVEELKPSALDETGPLGGSHGFVRGFGLERLGDFRIVREVGRGGMGVVYEAEQESLGRRVALKVLLSPVLLDPQKLARFHREAKAAARLHHTNIVPVFGVGESDGIHYYVMQFIPGAGLDVVLGDVRRLQGQTRREGERPQTVDRKRDLSIAAARALFEAEPAAVRGDYTEDASEEGARDFTSGLAASPSAVSGAMRSAATETGACYARSVARIGVQIAEALEHAHEQGILHRDIKPSNILLDAHGTAWVTDFGLAKAVADDDLTHTGDIVGTVRYMAPERFHGKCDVRSDVYALGLTLYELLARRPAFDASDRNALIRQVSQLEAPRLRKVDPSLPRDLETIVQKAIEKDPAHRYATAGALVDDLRRFLEDRPIEARRVSAGERLMRWSRRNPWVALLTASVFLLLVAIAAVSSSMAVRIHEEATRTRLEAHRAAQSAEAEVRARKEAEAARAVLRRTLYAAHMNLAQAAWESSNISRLGKLLDQERPNPGEPDLRGWEWSYLQSLRNSELTTLKGPGERLEGVAFSPDGKRIAACGGDGAVRFWDAASGTVLDTFETHAHGMHSLVFSPNGRQIAVAGGRPNGPGFLELWDAATGKRVWARAEVPGDLRRVAFSPDGRHLANGDSDGVVTIRNTASGASVQTLKGHNRQVSGVDFRPDGKRLAASYVDGSADIWDISSGTEVFRLTGHTGPVTVAYSPIGKTIVTAGADHVIRLWDAENGKLTYSVSRHLGPILDVTFSPDGTLLATAGADQAVRIIDPVDGREITSFRGHTNQVSSVAFSPDGTRLASAGFDGVVKLWDPRARHDGLAIKVEAPGSNIGRLAFSADGRLIAGAFGAPRQENSVGIWDAVTGRPISTLKGHDELISGLAFVADDRQVVTSSWDGTIRIWNTATGAELRRFARDERITAIAVRPDGRQIGVAEGAPDRQGRLELLDLSTGESAVVVLNQPRGPAGVAFSPDGKFLASANQDKTVKVWETATGTLRLTCTGHEQPVNRLAYSPDGRMIASAGFDMEIKLWDATTGKELRTYEGHASRIFSLGFSPDGRRLATASFDGVKLWDVDGGGELFSLKEQNRAAFSPDGQKLATSGEDMMIHIWDTTSRQPAPKASNR